MRASISVVKVSMSELWEQACQSHESERVRLTELSKRACQSCETEYVKVISASMSELKESMLKMRKEMSE